MINPKWVDYIRINRDKHPVESLKAALVKAGATPEQADEAARLAAEPPPPPPEAAPSGKIDVKELLAIAKRVLLSPREFFRSMPKSGGFQDPLFFLLLMAGGSAMLNLFFTLLFSMLGAKGFAFTSSIIVFVFGSIGTAVATLIFVPIGAFIGAAIVFVIWMLMGSKENYETAFRCSAYSAAVLPLYIPAGLLPYIGFPLTLAAMAYMYYLYSVASVEVHQIPQKKARLVFGCVAGVMLLSMIGSRIALWQARRIARSMQLNSMEPVAKGLQQMTAALDRLSRASRVEDPKTDVDASEPGAGSGKLESVDHRKLKAILPASLPGMSRTKAAGRRSKSMGMQVSVARARYSGQDRARIDIEITDQGGLGALGALANMAWTANEIDEESENGFQRTVMYGSNKALERYDSKYRSGGIEMQVGKRFMVKVEGSRVGMEDIRRAVNSIDIARLESLGK
ncbi:MAG: Yip1 family protein [Elusimicrobiota bacterium]